MGQNLLRRGSIRAAPRRAPGGKTAGGPTALRPPLGGSRWSRPGRVASCRADAERPGQRHHTRPPGRPRPSATSRFPCPWSVPPLPVLAVTAEASGHHHHHGVVPDWPQALGQHGRALSGLAEAGRPSCRWRRLGCGVSVPAPKARKAICRGLLGPHQLGQAGSILRGIPVGSGAPLLAASISLLWPSSLGRRSRMSLRAICDSWKARPSCRRRRTGPQSPWRRPADRWRWACRLLAAQGRWPRWTRRRDAGASRAPGSRARWRCRARHMHGRLPASRGALAAGVADSMVLRVGSAALPGSNLGGHWHGQRPAACAATGFARVQGPDEAKVPIQVESTPPSCQAAAGRWCCRPGSSQDHRRAPTLSPSTAPHRKTTTRRGVRADVDASLARPGWPSLMRRSRQLPAKAEGSEEGIAAVHVRAAFLARSALHEIRAAQQQGSLCGGAA